MNENTTAPVTPSLDLNVITRAVAAPLLVWTMVIGFAAWEGYPGAACMTPMAWLMGCWVGLKCAEHSRSVPSRRVIEAFIAGALLGFGQGLLFYIVQRMLLVPAGAPPDEVQKALILSVGILLFGTLFNGLFSMGTATMRNRRSPR